MTYWGAVLLVLASIGICVILGGYVIAMAHLYNRGYRAWGNLMLAILLLLMILGIPLLVVM